MFRLRNAGERYVYLFVSGAVMVAFGDASRVYWGLVHVITTVTYAAPYSET